MNVPQLRFKGFSDGWQSKQLKDIAQVYDGIHETPHYTSNGIPFISVAMI